MQCKMMCDLTYPSVLTETLHLCIYSINAPFPTIQIVYKVRRVKMTINNILKSNNDHVTDILWNKNTVGKQKDGKS